MKLLLLILLPFEVFTQVIYYQDIVKGGVSITGVATSDASGVINLPVHLSNNASIKKIFLVCYTIVGIDYFVNDYNFLINNNSIVLSDASDAFINVPINIGSSYYPNHRTNVKDITSLSSLIGSSITVDWSQFQFPPANCPGCRYAAPVIIVIYEDPLLTTTNIVLTLNNKANDQVISQYFTGLNPASQGADIALGIHSDRLAGNINDGYHFYINGTDVGICKLPENNIFGTGQIGSFYYENGVTVGLTNDIADAVFTDSDGILNINNYVNQQFSPFHFKCEYLDFPNIPHNYLIGANFAYTTPCQPQNVSVSSDTTICPNEPLQLFATGGVSYEWLPATGLSCSTCANPVFVGDSSQLYTVRIWGNDSCSVVRPVMVHVRQQPTIAALVPTTTTCGLNQGTVQLTLADTAAVQFAIDNGPLQDTAYFPNLSAGSHTLSLHDAVGCSFDTLVTIAADTTVSALFTATPSTGAAPLQVALSNQSTNATDYVWQLDGVTQANPFSSFTATTSGTVQVQLIAYQNNPSCADTAWTSIFVYDSVIVSIPNVFSPNNDNTNEFFGITSNTPLTISGALVNRWGQTMIAWEDQVTSAGFNQLWNGTNAGTPASDGVYFYHITWSKAGKTGELTGNVSLVR
jgi:gliding motility-associated-like protein